MLRTRTRNEKRSQCLAHSFAKRPEELERANTKGIACFVVLPGLAKADEAEGPDLGSADREVAGHKFVVQVGVVLVRVTDHARALTPIV